MYSSHSQIQSIVNQFNSATLPKSEWTHEAHCIVALWYLSTYEFYDAVCRIKSGIITLNNAQQTANTSSSGYHETITLFWSKVIEIYIGMNKQAGLEELTNGFFQSQLADRELPFEFYDKDYLLGAQLRCMYYPPDSQEINEHTLQAILQNSRRKS
ncbi:MAG: hypothetical protein IPM69_13890 [Ignavibacteria bacterium]|nr:hypothetical protein [Ignavibacteria bacterium]